MSPDRSLTELRDNPELQKRLLKYSAAASLAVAASLALPAGMGHADPGITCVDVDPATQPVIGGTFDIDFDDGNPEFQLIQQGNAVALIAQAGGGDAGQRVIKGASFIYGPYTVVPAAALGSSTTSISTGANFGAVGTTAGAAVYLGLSNLGPWPDTTDRYLGLKFTLDGDTHYGWALLDVVAGCSEFTIKKYCYNDVAGEGIHVGQTDAPPPEPVGGYVVPVNRLELLGPWLGAAAAGLAGLTAWWRRQLSRRGE